MAGDGIFGHDLHKEWKKVTGIPELSFSCTIVTDLLPVLKVNHSISTYINLIEVIFGLDCHEVFNEWMAKTVGSPKQT